MTTVDSRKPPDRRAPRPPTWAEELAALLHGLRYRGMAVGPDDAVRVLAAFAHAQSWSRERRIRTLKALLCRSDEERLLVDQLAPLLFVQAQHEAEPSGDVPALRPVDSLVPESHLGSRAVSRSDGEGLHAPRPRLPFLRLAWWRTRPLAVAGLVLLLVLLSLAVARHIRRPPSVQPPSATQAGPPPPDPSAGKPAHPPPPPPPPSDTADEDFRCEPGPLPPAPAWPYALTFVAAALFSLGVGLRLARAKRQERNIDALARSVGPRTYELTVPAGSAQPLPVEALREAAFHLSAPTQQVDAPWLDLPHTVRATLRRAGRLVLRYAQTRESRPILFIEDVAASMACWPHHAPQIVQALRRQGADVVHRFMRDTPLSLAADSDLTQPLSLDQELARLGSPRVVVFSDAAAIKREQDLSAWLAALQDGVWLHPRPVENWDTGARHLAGLVRVVPVSEAGLLRLGAVTCDAAADDDLPPRWTPPRTAGHDTLARLQALCDCLGPDAFCFLSAGAVLDRLGLLNTRLWWALRSDDITPPAAWERIERIWDLAPDVRVGPSGTVTLRPELREVLIATLTREHPALLSAVVTWTAAHIQADIASLPDGSAAQLAARMAHARLLHIDPTQRKAARRALLALSRAGYGGLLATQGSDDEQHAWAVPLLRQPIPARPILVAALGTFVLTLAAGTFTLQAGLRQAIANRLAPPRPPDLEFRAKKGEQGLLILPNDKELIFCDKNPLGGNQLIAYGETDQQMQLAGARQSIHGTYQYRLRLDSETMLRFIAKIGSADPITIRFSYVEHSIQKSESFRINWIEGALNRILDADDSNEIALLKAEDRLKEQARESAKLTIRIYPYKADTFIDGYLFKNAGLARGVRFKKGFHRIKVSHPNCQLYEKELRLLADRTLDVKLTCLSDGIPSSPEPSSRSAAVPRPATEPAQETSRNEAAAALAKKINQKRGDWIAEYNYKYGNEYAKFVLQGRYFVMTESSALGGLTAGDIVVIDGWKNGTKIDRHIESWRTVYSCKNIQASLNEHSRKLTYVARIDATVLDAAVLIARTHGVDCPMYFGPFSLPK